MALYKAGMYFKIEVVLYHIGLNQNEASSIVVAKNANFGYGRMQVILEFVYKN